MFHVYIVTLLYWFPVRITYHLAHFCTVASDLLFCAQPGGGAVFEEFMAFVEVLTEVLGGYKGTYDRMLTLELKMFLFFQHKCSHLAHFVR